MLCLERGCSDSSVLPEWAEPLQGGANHTPSSSPASHPAVKPVRGAKPRETLRGWRGCERPYSRTQVKLLPARFHSLDLDVVLPDCHSMGWDHPMVLNGRVGSRWLPSALRVMRSEASYAKGMGPLIVVIDRSRFPQRQG